VLASDRAVQTDQNMAHMDPASRQSGLSVCQQRLQDLVGSPSDDVMEPAGDLQL